jgi:hypothetical protein
MPKRRYLTLTESERDELEHVLRRDKRAYMRERASALLQIADGRSPHWVSQQGLLRRRKPDTVIGWLNAYEEGGLAGLVHRPRRKRGFPP